MTPKRICCDSYICRIDFYSIDPTEPTLNNKNTRNSVGREKPEKLCDHPITNSISTRNQNTILYLQDRNSERKRIG